MLNLNEVSKLFLEYTVVAACEHMEDTLNDNLSCDVLRDDRIAVIWGVAVLSLLAYTTKLLVNSGLVRNPLEYPDTLVESSDLAGFSEDSISNFSVRESEQGLNSSGIFTKSTDDGLSARHSGIAHIIEVNSENIATNDHQKTVSSAGNINLPQHEQIQYSIEPERIFDKKISLETIREENKKTLDSLVVDPFIWMTILGYLSTESLENLRLSCCYLSLWGKEEVLISRKLHFDRLKSKSNLMELVQFIGSRPASLNLRNIRNRDLECIKSLQYLTKLDLIMCDQIDDWDLRGLFNSCKNLTTLHLNGLVPITGEGLKDLSESCKNLTTLHLYSCGQITDVGLKSLSESCKNLTTLYLYECGQITDVGLKSLSESCKNLTRLVLYSCGQITDVGLKSLSESCKNLKILCLNYCTQITDEGLKSLFESCKNLKHLELFGCDQITNSGMKKFTQELPHVTVFGKRL